MKQELEVMDTKKKQRQSPLEARLIEFQRLIRLRKKILSKGSLKSNECKLALELIKRKVGE